MADQQILVTGAAGNLGQDLVTRLKAHTSLTVTGTTSTDLNLTWPIEKLHLVLDELNPDVIVNAAAYTDVDGAETQLEKAYQVNAEGPRKLAEWVAKRNKYMVEIGTDYVFDGTKGGPYQPYDSVNPLNEYGRSKQAGEGAVLALLPENGAVVRTSWLFGPGQKNFVPFLLRSADAKTPIRVVKDQWGTPTWTGNLSDMLLEVLENRPTGILHGCSKGMVIRYEQALFLYEALGVSSELISPVTSASFSFPAQRPVNTAMVTSFDSAMDWQEATLKFLQCRHAQGCHA